MAEHKARTGAALSFTGFIIFCLARAVDEDKSVRTIKARRPQIKVIFLSMYMEHRNEALAAGSHTCWA